MYKACYAAEMRAIDAAASETGFIPGMVLMENAAIACVNELKTTFDLRSCSVAVFCGKGNNGGDGLAIARHLYNLGAEVSVFLVSGNSFKGDAKINYDIAVGMDIPIETVTEPEGMEYLIRSFDIVIDAILGTGISGTVRGMAYDVITLINENAGYVLSVDVPSGINSDSGEICGVCINADTTVTFAAYKLGMLMYPGADCTGRIVVADISIPDYIIEMQNIDINVTSSGFVRSLIPERRAHTQKSDYGKLLIIAGSRGMSGAAYMAAQAALKSGAGLITLACCETVNAALEAKTTEVMTLPLPDNEGHIAAEAAELLRARLSSVDAVLVGPGLGRSADAAEVVRYVLRHSRVPVVVDADAINAVARDRSILSECACDLLFTPHAMEMSRLTELDVSFIEENRVRVSREFAEEYGAALLLKGHHTIVTAPELTQYINITGNAGMASGGSGDVLAGIAAALIARGISCGEAAAAAAYIHGTAGDIAAAEYGQESMSATDILARLPDSFKQILQLDK
ncbi:MAG: NAD(P)H-hydrate dehydratase [Clostridia bacterium]|nr:NAD(P)H-hydrate dehydratase [Clostridia bacterium]